MISEMAKSPKMRLYYFTPPEHAIENVQRQRLKISRFSKCNDGFELAAFELRDPDLRKKHRDWLTHIDAKHGLLCFSRNWRNPVMWGQYSKNMTGVCYGFDVKPEKFVHVRYVSERIFSGITANNFFDFVGEHQMPDLIATKFMHWSYEEEVRLLIDVSQDAPANETHFIQFSDVMELAQIIVGPKSTLRVKDFANIIDPGKVEVFQSRNSFKRFAVVRQRDKSLW